METWRAVVGFESYYEVSNHGRVRRIAPWCDGRKTKPSSSLTGVVKKSGYRRVLLHRERVPFEFAVHRLVAAAFIGPLPAGYQVNHKNGTRSDNRADNLEYLTPSQNQLHAYRILKRDHFKGSGSPGAKLTEANVVEMRKLRDAGWKVKDIASHFSVSASTACWIIKRKTWTHV